MAFVDDETELRARLARAEALADARKTQVELVAAVGHALVARASPPEQLRATVDAIARILDASSVRVWSLDDDARSFHLLASAGPADVRALVPREMPASTEPYARVVARVAPVVAALPEDSVEKGTFVGSALLVEGNVWGVLAVVADDARVKAAVDVLSIVTDQLALAVARRGAKRENARLESMVAEGHEREAAQKKAEEQALRELAADLERRVVERTKALEEANKELEAFSYSVSHDLRAPVRHIAGFTDMLLRHCKDELDARGLHYANTIASSAKQAGALIDDLLAFARVGRVEVVRRPVDLDELVASVRREVIMEAHGRVVEWKIGKLPTVTGDPALLRLVLKNLLSNAMKYTKKQILPVVEVTAHESDRETVVVVKDNGVGFDMKHAHKLFGVFQRLHRSEEFEGTGIGLANVRRIVQRHGGRTFAEGVLNEGATFTFTLPRLSAYNTASSASPSPSPTTESAGGYVPPPSNVSSASSEKS